MKKLFLYFLALTLLSSPLSAQPLALGCSEWKPYVDTSRPDGGPLVDLISQAFHRQKKDVTFSIMPWVRVLTYAERGELVVFCAWHTEEREKIYAFSEPFLENRVMLVKLKSNDFSWSKIEDFKYVSVAVERGAAYGKIYDKAEFLEKHIVTSAKQQLMMVLKGRADVAILSGDRADLVMTELSENERQDLDFVERPMSVKTVHLIISRQIENHREIILNFNQAMQELRNDGTYDRILSDAGLQDLRYPKPKTYID